MSKKKKAVLNFADLSKQASQRKPLKEKVSGSKPLTKNALHGATDFLRQKNIEESPTLPVQPKIESEKVQTPVLSNKNSEQRQSKPETNSEHSQNKLRTTIEPSVEEPLDNALEFKTKNKVRAILEQTQNKGNLEQTENKVRTKVISKAEQTQSEVGTKSEQQRPVEIETKIKVVSEPRTQGGTNLDQTQNEVRTNEGFLSLVGVQAKMIQFIYNICRAKGTRTTDPVTISQLANACKTTPASAQVTTRRLMKKCVLIRASFKNGRGGWTRYELPENIYSELFNLETQNKLETNQEQSQNKARSQPGTESRTTGSSSNSENLNLKNQTTNTDLSEDWLEIITPQSIKDIGFGRSQLIQVSKKGQLSAEDLQKSLDQFSYDLENQAIHPRTGPLNYFMGIVNKNGVAYISESYLKAEKEDAEAYIKRQAEAGEAKKLAGEKKLEIAFVDWSESIGDEEKRRVAPPMDFLELGSSGHDSMLRK